MHRRISSFAYLNIVQFLGALNDNIFKSVIVFLAIGILGDSASNTVLALSGAAFVMPFLLFSLPAGTLSDRHSKRNITVATKMLEVVIMVGGIVVFSLHSIWGSYGILFLMATQSAFFGPSKYGLVPELVRIENITRANGILTGLTVIATILGTFLASLFTTITHRNFPLIAIFCTVIAILGLLASLLIEKTPKAGSTRRININIVGEIYRVLKRARTENYLVAALLGSAFFFLAGAYLQLNIITYGIQSLHLNAVQGNYIFAVASVGIACGAYLAGRISGDEVELGLCPISGVFMSVCMMMLFVFQHVLWISGLLLFVLGLFGGIFLVPFDAYIQSASPIDHRGENIAAGNLLSFVGVLVATLLIYFMGDLLGLKAATGFLWVGILTFVVALIFALRLSDCFIRLLSRLHFHLRERHIHGQNRIPLDRPTILICEAQNWWQALRLMITVHQRYMRFLMEQPTEFPWYAQLVCRLAKVELYHQLPEPGTKAYTAGKRWLDRGYSLTLLPAFDAVHTRKALLEDIAHSLADRRESPVLWAKVTQQHIKEGTPLTISISDIA